MQNIKVDYDTLKTINNNLKTKISTLKSELNAMKKMQGTMEECWQGTSSDNFQDIWNLWHENIYNWINVLEKINETLSMFLEISVNVDNTEKSIINKKIELE